MGVFSLRSVLIAAGISDQEEKSRRTSWIVNRGILGGENTLKYREDIKYIIK